MATVEAVDLQADGSSVPAGQYHSAELDNLRRAANGLGVVGHTIDMTVTGGNRLVTLAAFDAICPDGSGGSKLVSYAGGDATITASDATDPRTDIITMDVNGTLAVTAGTATTETGTVNEAPMPALASDEVMIAKVRSPALQTNVQPGDVVGRAIDISEAQPAYVKGSDIASGATLTLPDTNAQYFHVTGTTTITALSTKPAGFAVILEFDSSLTMTYNGTTMILSGAVDFTPVSTDVITLISEGSGNWREISRRSSTTNQSIILKAATETITTSTALQNDDDFLLSVAANETWIIDLYLYMVTNASAGFQFQWAVPAGTAGAFMATGFPDGVAVEASQSGTITTIGGLTPPFLQVHIHSSFRMAATAGTLQFTWGPTISDAADTAVVKDSYMVATKVS